MALSQVNAGTGVLDRRGVNLCVPQSACTRGGYGRYPTANWGRDELAARSRFGRSATNRHEPSAPIVSCAAWTMRTAVSGNGAGRVRRRMTCGSGSMMRTA